MDLQPYDLKYNLDLTQCYSIKKDDKTIEFIKRTINKDALSLDESLSMNAKNGNLTLVSYYMKEIGYNQKYYASALFNSFIQNHVEVTKLLIENGATFTYWNDILIDQIIRDGNLEMVKLFLNPVLESNKSYDYSISFNKDSSYKKLEKLEMPGVYNYLHESIHSDNLEMVKYFVNLGLIVSIKDLHKAFFSGNEDIMRYLLTLYSEEELVSFIKKYPEMLIQFLKKKELSKYEKVINAYRMCGIDIFDLIENEKF